MNIYDLLLFFFFFNFCRTRVVRKELKTTWLEQERLFTKQFVRRNGIIHLMMTMEVSSQEVPFTEMPMRFTS